MAPILPAFLRLRISSFISVIPHLCSTTMGVEHWAQTILRFEPLSRTTSQVCLPLTIKTGWADELVKPWNFVVQNSYWRLINYWMIQQQQHIWFRIRFSSQRVSTFPRNTGESARSQPFALSNPTYVKLTCEWHVLKDKTLTFCLLA